MDERPDPDQLLKRVQADETSAGRGRLKLFFGAGPGVGKTYAMLEAARQRKKEGWDVVVGVVETHGRTETEALLEGLEILSRKESSYKGIVLKDFDLDGAIARRPRLLLVDELAHTNPEQSRHAKRWQDVEELLAAGIDVYTTLNVQHWETLNDVVAQITGVVVRETVPDTFLSRAAELELVDLAPEDLLKRLQDGKVYHGDMAGRAADNFFKPGNLIALRELALRHTAERVDAQMRAFKERHDVKESWPVGERLMVGVTGSPMSARLIRAAARLATRLHAPWIAVHVETPASLQDRGRIADNLRFAEELGAETVVLSGEDVTEEMLALARGRDVTRIVLGKPASSRWRDRLFGSVVSEFARKCGDIDIHVTSGPTGALPGPRPVAAKLGFRWMEMGWGAAVVAICTCACWPLASRIELANLVMIYLLGIIWTAYRFGRRASFIASIMSVLAFDYFFVPPAFTLNVSDVRYVPTFLVMLGVGFFIGTITGRLRRQTEALRKREERLRVLYRLSRELSETPDTHRMLEAAQRRLQEFWRMPVMILTAGASGGLTVAAGDPGPFDWNDNERSVARWVYDKGQSAGAGSDTLGGSKGLYFPLTGIRSTVGVLAVRPADAASFEDPDQLRLMETFAGEIGGALESTRMSESVGRAEMQAERQVLGSAAPAGRARLGDFLTPDRIRILPPGLPKERVIRDLLSRLDLPNPTQAFEAVLEREKAGPTLIGADVAVPHARLEDVKGLQAALGISREGPVRVWVVFVGPKDNPAIHLSFLSGVSAFFQKEGRADSLSGLKSGKGALDYIRAAEISPPA
jgi:two-component system sensor histidine kinase KdpD